MYLCKLHDKIEKIIREEAVERDKLSNKYYDLPEGDEKQFLRTKIAIMDEIENNLWDLIYFIEDHE